MAVIRHKLNDYEYGEGVLTKRDPEDFDLGWGDNRIYVLDAHEWWDPHTSSKYSNNISRHAMYGPSVIVHSRNGGGESSHEYHVNDPSAWAYVRRCIDEGHAAKGNLPLGPSYKESLVTIRSAAKDELDDDLDDDEALGYTLDAEEVNNES